MKYTVVIRQPVPEEVRGTLETQLSERFGLKPEQAQRLAARRSGRLMKPTSRARADLLLQVFQAVNAQVYLEEVRDEDKGLGMANTTIDTSLANLEQEQRSAAPESAAPDPFAAAAGPDPLAAALLDWARQNGQGTSDPFASTDPFAPNTSQTPALDVNVMPESDAALFTTDAVQVSRIAPDDKPDQDKLGAALAQIDTPAPMSAAMSSAGTGLSGSGAATGLGDLPRGQASTGAAQTAAADGWGDFTQSLASADAGSAAKDEAMVVSDSPNRQGTEFLTAVTEDSSVANKPRNSLVNQIRYGTLIPILLSGLLSAMLLSWALPRLQRTLILENAQSIAATLGPNISTNEERVMQQIDRVLTNPNIGFVRVEYPNGASIFRAKADTQAQAQLNETVAEWVKTSPDGGPITLAGQPYLASRISVIETPDQIITDAGSRNAQGVKHRVTVGLSMGQAADILRNTLLLIGLATGLGLLLATLLAARSARTILEPLERLVKVADAISLGDLTRPVRAERNDEIGDLAQALERMRLSLEAAMDRLRRRKRS